MGAQAGIDMKDAFLFGFNPSAGFLERVIQKYSPTLILVFVEDVLSTP